MINYNKKDKFVSEIAKELQRIPVVLGMKDATQMYIYGVKKDRDVDVVLPERFPHVDFLIDYFRRKGIRAKKGCYWEMASEYRHRVMGLGYDFRQQNLDHCKKAILSVYLALNGKLEDLKGREQEGRPRRTSIPSSFYEYEES